MLLSSNPSICASNGRSCRLRKPSSWRQSSRSTGEEALHARVAKTQSAGALPLNASWALQGFECLRADSAVVAGFLDLEHAAVGRKADLAQLGQIAQKAPHAEVVGVVDGGFGTQAPHRACPFCDTA